MKSILLIACIVLTASTTLYSQYSPDDVAFSRLLFAPLIAHHVEARMGATRFVNEERLQLDIGNAVDIWRTKPGANSDHFAVGAECFTWTALRKDADFHFPVDAVDYMFGVNASWRRPLHGEHFVSARFRFSHISAHLVDGAYDKEDGTWRDGQLPRVYSREFLDIIAAYGLHEVFRIYAGFQYVYHIDPPTLGKLGAQAGMEISWTDVFLHVLHAYVAYDLRTVDVDAVTAAHSLQIGMKVGAWQGTGVRLFISVYHGKSIHGQYHEQTWSQWGPGFSIDF